jgi:SAM-dependent methyltransferase
MPYCAAPKLVKTIKAATLANRSLYHGHELSELVHNPRNSVTQAIMMQRLRITNVPDFIPHNFFDVGCGAGFALLTALDTGFMRPVVGIDWDDHMLQNITRPCLEGQGYAHGVDFLLIKANVRKEGSAEWIRGNLRGRGFADNFGFIYCEGVVECAPAKDRAKILVNCRALGLPGGMLHVSMNLLRPSLDTHDADLERRGIEPVAAVGSLVLMKEGPPGLWGDDVQTTPVYAALAIQVSPESAWGLAEAQVQHELLRILGLDLDSADWLRIGDAEEFFLTQAEGVEVPTVLVLVATA